MEERVAHLERVNKALLKRLPPCEKDQHTLDEWHRPPYQPASGWSVAVETKIMVRNCLGCNHYRISCNHADSMVKCSKGALKNPDHTSMCTVCGFTEVYQEPPATTHIPEMRFHEREKRPRPIYDGPPSLFGGPASLMPVFGASAATVATPAFGVPAVAVTSSLL